MGFFSWETSDTNESIPNVYANRPGFTVHMIDDKGNVWTEEAYEGYGDFGGKDYYELLAEMNGLVGRNEGIALHFNGGPDDIKYPRLVRNADTEYASVPTPENCPYQGFFYD